MTYKLKIRKDVYRKWKAYDDWLINIKTESTFSYYLVKQYPDCLLHVSINTDEKTFTFISEAHYTWFCLKQ